MKMKSRRENKNCVIREKLSSEVVKKGLEKLALWIGDCEKCAYLGPHLKVIFSTFKVKF